MTHGMRWRALLPGIERLVVKVGTSTLTGGGHHLRPDRLDDLVRQLIELHRRGLGVTLVTSGAIVTGAARLHLDAPQRSVRERQALAAVGQAMLMHEYDARFAAAGVVVAQLLLTAEDFDKREALGNARNTIEELLGHRVVPIVNENDTVATDEIRIGDNDTLSARVAALVNAQLLCILSDVDGLYTSDPRDNPRASRVELVDQVTDEMDAFARRSRSASTTGVGGMVTKLTAARIATAAGTAVAIVDGGTPDVIGRLLAGDDVGTRILPRTVPLRGRQRWVALRTRVEGRLRIDWTAVDAITSGRAGLLPAAVMGVEGDFAAGDVVAIIGPDGTELGRAVASHDRDELEQMIARAPARLRALPGNRTPEAVHPDSLVILR